MAKEKKFWEVIVRLNDGVRDEQTGDISYTMKRYLYLSEQPPYSEGDAFPANDNEQGEIFIVSEIPESEFEKGYLLNRYTEINTPPIFLEGD